MTKKEKRQFLKENNWGAHYRYNCWFDHSKDNLDVNDKGEIIGFQPEEDGIKMEQAFKICIINLAKENEKRRNSKYSK
tara:strand:- start:1217 stop:1450 length:234 start_codon:yes stop_codon:yes gene_type:complete